MTQVATTEPIWSTEGAEKRSAVKRMFAEIAPVYDLLNGLMSLSLHGRWRALAVGKLNLRPGGSALDVCCGTGDFMKPLRKAVGGSGAVCGLDFCAPMLDRAKAKGFGELMLGDACNLPVASESFDAVSVGWGIRNVPDIDRAHREAFRVLRPGGAFVSLDMARPRSLAGKVSGKLANVAVPLLGRLFGKGEAYTYLPKSTQRFMSREQLAESMRNAGFQDVGWKDMMFGNVCAIWGSKP